MEAASVVKKIEAAGGKALALKANVAQQEDAKELIRATREASGPIDIRVNNAGVYALGSLEHITPEHFHRHFDLNVVGCRKLPTSESLTSRISVSHLARACRGHGRHRASSYSRAVGQLGEPFVPAHGGGGTGGFGCRWRNIPTPATHPTAAKSE